VDHSAAFGIGDFGDAKFRVRVGTDPACVEDLAAAGGIEGGAVENQPRTGRLEDLADFRVEIVEERIVVVETGGSWLKNHLTTEGTEDAELLGLSMAR
jgi:hypothetical protein